MSYEQIKAFYPKEMGKKKGWCLQNCRLGFRIYTGKYASAKSAYEAAKKNGTLREMNELPSNISVPVYQATTSKYGHVIVYDKGIYYSDGCIVRNPKGLLGWDIRMDGVDVVKFTTANNFLPAKGYWCEGDCDPRIGSLSLFMRTKFPAYTSAKALGNYYGKYIKSSITEFQRRTNLYPDGCVGPRTYDMLKQYGFKY
jgi:murein L,D-transpeptidase YcbB/YkuD